MNRSQHKCKDQETQTHKRSLNGSLGDTLCSALVPLGGQLLNGSTSIRQNTSPQPPLTFVMQGPLCTIFDTDLRQL
ncbi:hypothetical protein TNCV_3907341 [Trichonephila clavipes]|nr:hypothetical protein TNCV_3907341 [Trichonephila clavipes]